jgi:hypothetical protein
MFGYILKSNIISIKNVKKFKKKDKITQCFFVSIPKLNIYNTKQLIHLSSLNGYIHILKWLKRNKFKIKYDCNALYYAFENKHHKIIKWFIKNTKTKKLIKILSFLKNYVVNHSITFKKILRFKTKITT